MNKTSPATSREALEQCAFLWEAIASNDDIRDNNKKEWLSQTLFDYEPLYGCPACHWANMQTYTTDDDMCSACPIGKWRGAKYLGGCTHDKKSYWLWRHGNSNEKRRKGALAVARLAQESIFALDNTYSWS